MGANLQFLEGFGIQIGRVRIQIGNHARDGIADHLLVFNGLDVALLDRVEDFGKGPQVLNRQAGCRLAARRRFFAEGRNLQRDQDADKDADEPDTRRSQPVWLGML